MYLFRYFALILIIFVYINLVDSISLDEELSQLRERTKSVFYHAYNGYLNHAYPYDELRPLTCDGVNTWGKFSLTLVDALDTLAVMNNHSEFRRVSKLLEETLNDDIDVNASVFETNIRVVGGLLSAHLLSRRSGVNVLQDWPCRGPLLDLAVKFAKRLLPAFNTSTGMPFGTVNLRYGVDAGETPETCTAGVGTYIIEFGTLSRLTGDPIYETVALRALNALYARRSLVGLVGNHIDVESGKWTALDSGIGAGVDSYFEYLVKGSFLLNNPYLLAEFKEYSQAVKKYLKQGDWYMWGNMNSGSVTMPVFQSLEAFWPGIQTLVGDVEEGYKSLLNYFEVLDKFGATPEFYSIPHKAPYKSREGYPLRPELVESMMYVYQATKDPLLIQMGKQILHMIETSAKTECGFATIKDVRDHLTENRMESFFLAETCKYLFLLFDPNNFIFNSGSSAVFRTLSDGRECVLEAGGYIFNTEAHPIDPAALHCCTSHHKEEENIALVLQTFDIEDGSENPPLCSLTMHDEKQIKFWNITVPCENQMKCKPLPFHMKYTKQGQIRNEV